jgi:circadian clock protein KaiC
MARTRKQSTRRRRKQSRKRLEGLSKCPTGIDGLDEVTSGGLPRGRCTLVCGGPGCGKSLMGAQFLVSGIQEQGEPGVLMTFEESVEDTTKNFASLGFDIDALVRQQQLIVDHVVVDRSQIEETGEYDLEGLFIRLGLAVDSIGAQRVVLDTIESLFGGLSNEAVLRSELRRLFGWLKDRGLTTIVTGERGNGTLTRQGLEEYVSDCVIVLDHRVTEQISTRRLRVVKYRGSTHGTNEYPFLIDESGITVLPVTAVALEHEVSNERISTGVSGLDEMLGGEGFFRGSSVLVSGTAGTGKTSLACGFAAATCRRGETCLYFAFEESPQQIIRNMRSVGVNLEPYVKNGRLRFTAHRATHAGLEMHLASMIKRMSDLQPAAVIIDPISDLMAVGNESEAKALLVRLVDHAKHRGITVLLTNLTHGGDYREMTEVGVSSMVDTWLLLRDIEFGGERNRGMYVLKSRGTAHSNQIREFLLTPRGIELVPVYTGPEGVLTGSARLSQEAHQRALAAARQEEIDRRVREIETKRQALEARIAAMRAEFEAQNEEDAKQIEQARKADRRIEEDRADMAVSRWAKSTASGRNRIKTDRQGGSG